MNPLGDIPDVEVQAAPGQIPFQLRHYAIALFRYGKSLTQGEQQNRRLAVRVFQAVSYIHPDPARAIKALADLYKEGTGGVDKNLEKYFYLLRSGASLWDGDCVYFLAHAYCSGVGTMVNRPMAANLFRLIWEGLVPHEDDEWVADSGMELAQLLTKHPEEFRPRQVEQAVEIYENLRTHSLVGAQATVHLGRILREGTHGARVDLVRARQVYEEGLNLGNNEQVYFELAWMLEYGQGGPVNLPRAYFYYSVSFDHGVEEANEKMEQVNEKIKAASVAKHM